MNSQQLGLESPAPAGGEPQQTPGSTPQVEGGQTPDAGTAQTPVGQGAPQPSNNEGTAPDAGTPQADGQKPPAEVNQQRVNDLMSKWQSEEAQRVRAEAELKNYQNTYGPLPGQQTGIQQPAPTQQQQSQPDQPKALQQGWAPQTMEELQNDLRELYEAGRSSAIAHVDQQAQARQEAQSQVDTFIQEVRQADSEFDEKAFYDYANTHKFPVNSVGDLRSVYSSFVELRRSVANAQSSARQNVEQRNQDTVNVPGSGGNNPSPLGYKRIANASSSMDAVREALGQ